MRIYQTVINDGKTRFCLSWAASKKRYRKFFLTRAEAEKEMLRLSRETKVMGDAFLSVSMEDRAEMVSLWSEAVRHSINLRDALTHYINRDQKPHVEKVEEVKISVAIEKFLVEKSATNVGFRAMAAYNSILGRFADSIGRERSASTVTRDDVMGWLKGLSPITYNTYLTSLKSFFKWAHTRAEIIASDPAIKVDKIGKRQIDTPPPCILNAEMAGLLLAAAERIAPDIIPVLALSLFAGARPQEAQSQCWENIRESIYFPPAITKTRDTRHVEITLALAAWLEPHRKKSGSVAPVNLRRKIEDVRVAAGLTRRVKKPGGRGYMLEDMQREVPGAVLGWGHDCLRHSFGSNYFALHGAEKTIAQMGHAQRDYATFFNHYRACVTKKEATDFWALRPVKG